MQTQIRRRSACALAGTLAVLCAGLFAGPATAAKPGTGSNLQCFSALDGSCTLDAAGKTATLDNDGPYSGVTFSSPIGGKTLSRISALEFSYDGVAGAGAPRFSLPVDTDGDGATDAHVFIAAFYCNDGAGNVDAINDPTCTMQLGNETFENWDALVAAHGDYVVGDPVVVADETGSWTISDVRGSVGKAKG